MMSFEPFFRPTIEQENELTIRFHDTLVSSHPVRSEITHKKLVNILNDAISQKREDEIRVTVASYSAFHVAIEHVTLVVDNC